MCLCDEGIRQEILPARCCSGVHSRCQVAAINCNGMSGNETGAIRCEQNGSSNQLTWMTEARHRCALQNLVTTLCPFQQLGIKFGWKDPRSNRIHADSIPRPLAG